MMESVWITCPYCGEVFESEVDASAGSQRYIEDCYVCCRPIELELTADNAGRVVSLIVKRDDD
jgi:hypothetical protein